jgi:hypothetical protein
MRAVRDWCRRGRGRMSRVWRLGIHVISHCDTVEKCFRWWIFGSWMSVGKGVRVTAKEYG